MMLIFEHDDSRSEATEFAATSHSAVVICVPHRPNERSIQSFPIEHDAMESNCQREIFFSASSASFLASL